MPFARAVSDVAWSFEIHPSSCASRPFGKRQASALDRYRVVPRATLCGFMFIVARFRPWKRRVGRGALPTAPLGLENPMRVISQA